MQGILLVEEDPKDGEPNLTALWEYNLADEIVVAHDGAEALDSGAHLLTGRKGHGGEL